jgi:hypothetical protein
MNNPSYGQPAPVAPGIPPAPMPPAASPRPGPRRFVVPAVGVALVAVVAFGGGYAVANATASPSTTSANGTGNGPGIGQNFGQNFGPGASGRPRGGFGGNTSGTVGSVSADQMTVTTPNGSKIVLLTPTTTVTEVSSATKAVTDISSGNNVTVVGTANPDGSVTATSVVIGDLGVFGRGFRGGDNGSPAPSSAP